MQHRHRLVQLMSLLCFCGILPASAQSPIHQWRLGEPGRDREFIADLVGESPAQIVGNVEFDQSPALMRVSGKANYVSLSPKGTSIPLPTAAISLETWVALDKPTKYNNVIGCLQDNGSFEKGWLLGGHESHFQFAIGTDRLTYLKSETEFEPGRWYHLVGTYDGETMCLYLDGELESTSSKRTGPIQYADSWWRIAGYKDDNETYAFHGRIHEVAIYDQSLTPEQIRRRF
ncbi:MAG: hypothetical protein ACI91J_002221, partial [Yoonia sp.]